MGLKNLFKKLFVGLNRRGVSATVITILLVVIGLAVILVFITTVSRSGGENVQGIVSTLEQVKHGGG
ncbi:MAG: hypothetical protein PHC66_03740 [Candidatus Nanoarchaeia archaeon]|nr:hypothetical protein [Candidatus Nanoarchaeia archaeon]MDD5239207.1 hypothetical protein [Candidatus Nanoarchaeia archaeon]